MREKYPDAIVIYVHLLPLKDLLQNPETGLLPETLGLDSNMDWQWIGPHTDNYKFHTKLTHGTRKAVTEAGAYHFQLDFPQDPKVAMTWYFKDWFHLSDIGHIMVANGILRMLSAMQDDLFKPKRLGSFAKGDQCFHWFANGEAEISYSGTVMKKSSLQNIFSENTSDIWFLEIEADKAGYIQFENRFLTSVSVVLAYISNREIESIFSSVNATIADQPTVKINPNNFYSPKHIVQYAFIGNSLPGSNVVQLKSTDREAEDLRLFRVVALLLNEDTEHSKPLLMDGLDIPNYGRHIVFCSIPPDPRFSNIRVDNDQMEKVVSTAQIRLSSQWTTHVITSGEAAVYKLLSSPSARKAKVVDYHNAPSSHLLRRFNKVYLPQSPRDLEFEKFCIYRWIIILEYFEYIKMRGVSVDYIFSADTDFLVLESPFLMDKAIDWGGIEYYPLVSGAGIIWSLQGLHSFVTFIMEAYHSPREHMIELVRSYGAYVAPCQPGTAQYIPCNVTDTSCPSHHGTCMYQMSDMQWQTAWAAQNPMVRIRNTRYDCGLMNSMDQSTDYVFVHNGSEIQLKSGSSGFHKVCFVHFGGVKEVKNMIVPFYSFVFNADKSSSFLKPPNIYDINYLT